MLPWIYGFHWTPVHIIFISIFLCVLGVIATTVTIALVRARKAMKHVDEVRWETEFEDLLPADRVCRHEISGEFKQRTCERAFDCRECDMHGKLIAKKAGDRAGEEAADVLGIPVPLDRMYHRGHTWVKPESDGTLTIGLDAIGKRVIGEPDAVSLPEVGSRLHVNAPAWQMKRRDAAVRVLSPVEGEVVETGGADRGWFLRVRPEGTCNLKHLLSGAEVAPWMRRELDRLQLLLTAEGAAGLALTDGGAPVDDIAAAYPEMEWDAVAGAMFLEP